MLFVAITYHFLRYALYIRSYIQNGLEKVTKYMMCALLVLMVVLAVNSLLLKGAGEGKMCIRDRERAYGKNSKKTELLRQSAAYSFRYCSVF